MESEAPEDYRPLLFSVAYRMTGAVQEAEDIVQNVFSKYYSRDTQKIRDERNYLIRAVTNEAINRYQDLKNKRLEYPGVWLPEPLVERHEGGSGVADSENVRLSWLKLLEQLNPYERAVWVFREVFDFDYESIASFTDKTEASCRQLLKRAKEKLEESSFPVTNTSGEEYLKAFAEAVQRGDFSKIKALFREDIRLYSDGGGKVNAARKPVIGDENVFKFLQGIITQNPGFTMAFVRINGQPGIINYLGGEVDSVSVVDADEQGIQGIYIVRNPDKLSMARNFS